MSGHPTINALLTKQTPSRLPRRAQPPGSSNRPLRISSPSIKINRARTSALIRKIGPNVSVRPWTWSTRTTATDPNHTTRTNLHQPQQSPKPPHHAPKTPEHPPKSRPQPPEPHPRPYPGKAIGGFRLRCFIYSLGRWECERFLEPLFGIAGRLGCGLSSGVKPARGLGIACQNRHPNHPLCDKAPVHRRVRVADPPTLRRPDESRPHVPLTLSRQGVGRLPPRP